MIFNITDVVNEAKKQVEELTKKEFITPINFDKKKVNPNNFYFLCNDELNIEISVFFGQRNGLTDKDTLICQVQKPISKRESFDFRSIYTGEKCVEYIVNSIKELIK